MTLLLSVRSRFSLVRSRTHFGILELIDRCSVLGQLLPTTVLTASNADPKFVSFLESALSTLPPLSSASSAASLQSSSASALSGLPTRLEIRPAREFYAGQGRHLLSQLDIREGPWYSVKGEEDEPVSNRNDAVDGDAMRRNRELRLSSFINGLEKSPVTVRKLLHRLSDSSAHSLAHLARMRRLTRLVNHENEDCRRRSRGE